MIEKNVVRQIVEEWLADTEYFLVDVEVSVDNCIVVEIDHSDGVWIEDCVALSRFIESRLDRDVEDYELEVGSAGIGQPFKVLQQYMNNIGKEVEVLGSDGQKSTGVLSSVSGDKFVVLVKERVALEGKKRKVERDVEKEFDMSQVKYCKAVIRFK